MKSPCLQPISPTADRPSSRMTPIAGFGAIVRQELNDAFKPG